jgi:tetratricopeptide (TPR) repeat protein
MYQRALAGYEKALGLDHTSTLGTVNNLGNLYSSQGKLKEAQEMYQRALVGYERAQGTSTLCTVNNLGNLYKDQGKLKKAQEMYQLSEHWHWQATRRHWVVITEPLFV